MADNKQTVSRGMCKLPFSCHGYTATVPLLTMQMNTDFDIILGCDRIERNVVDIMFSTSSLHVGCSESDRK